MKVDGRPYRSIWLDQDGLAVVVIDQTRLPHSFGTCRLNTVEDAAEAIRTMVVRGAPLIGATAAYGLALALADDSGDANLESAITLLAGTRPTAVNLRWALEDLGRRLRPLRAQDRAAAAYRRAGDICDEDVAINRAIGENGLALVEQAARGKDGPINVLTHCNAGWLGYGRLGHGAGPALHGPRQGHSDPCLGRRDQAAQPGRRAHRVGAGAPRRAAHGDRGQCRRPSDAARHGRSLHHRHRPHDRPAAMCATRSAPI